MRSRKKFAIGACGVAFGPLWELCGHLSTCQSIAGWIKAFLNLDVNIALAIVSIGGLALMVWAVFRPNARMRGPEGMPGFKVPDIGGDIHGIRLKSHGFISRQSGERMVTCELGMDLALHNPENAPIEISDIILTTWPFGNRPVQTLNVRSNLGVPFDLEGSPRFSVDARIEFLDDGSNRLPSSLWMMLQDQYNAKHFIPLRSGVALPELPNAVV